MQSHGKGDPDQKKTTQLNIPVNTPLQYATEFSYKNTILSLLEKGANPNLCNQEGQSPLHAAILHHQDEEVLLALLAHGADPNLQDDHAKTALHYAIEQNAPLSTIQLLLNHHANPDIIDKFGASPLITEFKKHLSPKPPEEPTILLLLLQSIQDASRLKANQQSLLLSALRVGQHKILEAYLKNQYSLDIDDEENRSVLQIATVTDLEPYIETIKILLANKAQVNARNKRGETALHTAAIKNCPCILTLLLDEKNAPEVNAKDNKGLTPLHHVLKSTITADTDSLANILLEKGANISEKDKEGNTALHFLAKHLSEKNSTEEMKNLFFSLIKSGADPLIKNNKGETPLHILLKKGSVFKWEDETLPIEWKLKPFFLQKELDASIDYKDEKKKEVILTFSGKSNKIDPVIRIFKEVFPILKDNKKLISRTDNAATKSSQCAITIKISILHDATLNSESLPLALTKKESVSKLKPLSLDEFLIWENAIKNFFFDLDVTIHPHQEGTAQLSFNINSALDKKSQQVSDTFLENEMINRFKKSLSKSNLAICSYNKDTKVITVKPLFNLSDKDASVLQSALKPNRESIITALFSPQQNIELDKSTIPAAPPTPSTHKTDDTDINSKNDPRKAILEMLTTIVSTVSETNFQFLNLCKDKKNYILLVSQYALPILKTKEGSAVFIKPDIFFETLESIINNIQPETISTEWNESAQTIKLNFNKKSLDTVSKKIQENKETYQNEFKKTFLKKEGTTSKAQSFRCSEKTEEKKEINESTLKTKTTVNPILQSEIFTLNKNNLTNLQYHLDKLLDHPDFSILKTDEQKEIYSLTYHAHLNCAFMLLAEANKNSIFLPLRDTLRHFHLNDIEKVYTLLEVPLHEIKRATTLNLNDQKNDKSLAEKILLFTSSEAISTEIKLTTLKSVQELFNQFKNEYKPKISNHYKAIFEKIMLNPEVHDWFNYQEAAIMAASLAGETDKTPPYGTIYKLFGHQGYKQPHYEAWIKEQFEWAKEQFQQSIKTDKKKLNP